MAAFVTFDSSFQESYAIVLKYFKNNMIDILNESPWMRRFSWLQFLVYILAVISHTGGALDRVAEGADLVQLATDLSATLVLWQACFLYIQIQTNRKLIKKLIMSLGEERRSDEHLRPEMVVLKQTCAKSLCTWIPKFYKVLCYFTHLYMGWPLIYSAVKRFVLKDNAPLTTPFRLKVPFLYEDNFLVFSIMYMVDYVTLYNTGFLITSDLLLMNVSMSHLRVLFLILQDDLRNIVHSAEETYKQTIIRSRLNEIITKHGTLLKLMVQLAEAFGAIFLIHLAFFSGTVCFFGFAARVHCSPESIKNLFAACYILICIYSCCSYGQDLTDASLDVATAAYEGPWTDMTQDYKTCILLIILRSQKTYYIKSTSFTDISLESFTKVRSTWHYSKHLLPDKSWGWQVIPSV